MLALTHSPKQRIEEFAGLGAGAFGGRTGKFKTSVPVGRRSEFLSRLQILGQLVVRGTLLCVAEDLVGLADLLKLRFGAWVLVDVRMEFAGELAIGPLHLVLCRAPLHT